MKKIFILVFWLLFTVSAFAGSFSPFNGRINADKINLRTDATTGSEIITVLSKGQDIEVVDEAYDWYKVRLPSDAPSYVRKDLVECVKADTAPNNTIVNSGGCLSAKVVKDRINIRLKGNESSWILGKADRLTILNVISEYGNWYKIQPIYKSYGWINKKFVDKAPAVLAKEEPAVLPEKPQAPEGQLVLEGIINPYGMVLWRRATHKLITADNKIYLLKGNRKSLNALNYHKVKITGKLITPAQRKFPILQIDIIEALN